MSVYCVVSIHFYSTRPMSLQGCWICYQVFLCSLQSVKAKHRAMYFYWDMSIIILILLNKSFPSLLPSLPVTPFSQHISPSALPSLSVFLCLHHVKHYPLNMPFFNTPIFSISALPIMSCLCCALCHFSSAFILCQLIWLFITCKPFSLSFLFDADIYVVCGGQLAWQHSVLRMCACLTSQCVFRGSWVVALLSALVGWAHLSLKMATCDSSSQPAVSSF